MLFQKPCIELRAHPDFSAFQFTSRGPAGSIIRQVRFTGQKGGNIYNLDINDLHPKDPSARTITDNGDMNHVMTTLLQIIEVYTERYPDRVIRLEGNTKEKVRLYRTALDKHVDIIYPHFEIGLELGNRFFPPHSQNPDCVDDISFILKRRPGLCVSIHSIQTTRNSRSLLFGQTVSVQIHRNVEVGVKMVETPN